MSYNYSHHRAFDVLWHRALLYEQAKIAFLEKELEKIDRDEAADPESAVRLKEASFDLDSLLSLPYISASQTPCQTSRHMQDAQLSETAQASNDAHRCGQLKVQGHKDQILEALLPALIRYCRGTLLTPSIDSHADHDLYTASGLTLLNKVDGLHKTSHKEHQTMIKSLKRDVPIKEESWQFLKFTDDFVSTRTDRVHHPFESFIYNDGPIPVCLYPTRLTGLPSNEAYVIAADIFQMVFEEQRPSQ